VRWNGWKILFVVLDGKEKIYFRSARDIHLQESGNGKFSVRNRAVQDKKSAPGFFSMLDLLSEIIKGI
jgi:hypothetical protein